MTKARKTRKAIRIQAAELKRTMIHVDRNSPRSTFGEFCAAIELRIEDWKAYRQALADEADLPTANPSAWEALAWVKAGKPAMC